nr:MAG TPA: hypothetical protein [Caudoviricetes sp.]
MVKYHKETVDAGTSALPQNEKSERKPRTQYAVSFYLTLISGIKR